MILKTGNAPFWLMGDFNLPDVDWASNSTCGNQNSVAVNHTFTSTISDCRLHQMVDFPPRNDATLDLFLTNRPSMIRRITPIPGISDHDALFIDSDVEIKLQRQPKRSIYIWNMANIHGLQDNVEVFSNEFVRRPSTEPVEDLWAVFKSECHRLLNTNVPSKVATQRYSQPWITRDLKRLTRKKKRYFKRYRKTQSTEDHEAYKSLKKEVHVRCKDK